jgi:hypothetical protein
MDGSRFDALTKSLSVHGSRRRVLALFASGLLGVGGRRAVAARVCGDAGTVCRENANCCSGLCGKDASGRRVCVCPAQLVTCGGLCVDPTTAYLSDTANCGACGHRCPSAPCKSPTCTDGVCRLNSNPAADGKPCDDGNRCTTGTTCEAGTCGGGITITCTALDQCHLAGTCDPQTGLCSNPNAPDNTGCDDGKPCTTGDVCTGGACAGTPVADGTGCGTGLVCFGATCQAGCVVAGVFYAPDADDPNNTCRSCQPAVSATAFTPKPDNSPCNDGNACTQTDTCQGGTCVGGNPVVCTASDQCHDVGTCDTSTGLCSNPAKADGFPCDDGSACTAGDQCIGGTCAPGPSCPAPDDCHDVGTCAGNTCTYPVFEDGRVCQLAGQTVGQFGHCCAGGACLACCSDSDCEPPATCGGGGTPNVCGTAGGGNCAALGHACSVPTDCCSGVCCESDGAHICCTL